MRKRLRGDGGLSPGGILTHQSLRRSYQNNIYYKESRCIVNETFTYITEYL